MHRLIAPLAAIAALAFAGAAAAEVGTCLTVTGISAAPWSDGDDPACGDDCADDDGGCASEEQCTEPRAEGFAPLRMPAPTGPLCISGGPGCKSAPPGSLVSSTGLAGAEARAGGESRPSLGSLPGPDNPPPGALTTQTELEPRAPPPR